MYKKGNITKKLDPITKARKYLLCISYYILIFILYFFIIIYNIPPRKRNTKCIVDSF
jgi:hypothetical protein